MLYLRADTAVEVPVGPAVDVNDGFTPITTLSIAGADEAELLKFNAAGTSPITTTAISGALVAITGADGYYSLEISASELDTEGFLVLLINDDSLILPIRLEFMVVNANVYDSLFDADGVDKLQIDVVEQVGTTVPAPNTNGIPDVNVREWLDLAVTLSTGNKPDVNVDEWADVLLATTNPLPNAVAGATGGIFIAGTNAATVVTSSFTTTFTGDVTGSVASVTGAVGSVTGAVGSVTGNVDGNVSGSVGSVSGHTNQTGDSFARIGAAGVSLTNLGGMSAGMSAEVQIEANDALIANNLDHLLLSAVPISFEDTVDIDSVIGQLAQDGTGTGTGGGGFNRETDSLEAIRDNQLVAVNAALDTAISELSVAAPTATPTIRTGIMLGYMALRNRFDTQTSGTDALELYDDGGTLITKKLITDAGGDYSEAQMSSG